MSQAPIAALDRDPVRVGIGDKDVGSQNQRLHPFRLFARSSATRVVCSNAPRL